MKRKIHIGLFGTVLLLLSLSACSVGWTVFGELNNPRDVYSFTFNDYDLELFDGLGSKGTMPDLAGGKNFIRFGQIYDVNIKNGEIFIVDTSQHRIIAINTTTDAVRRVAGLGYPEYSGDGGLATETGLFFPSAVAVANDGTVYIKEAGRHTRIRKINLDGTISTLGKLSDLESLEGSREAVELNLIQNYYLEGSMEILSNGDLLVVNQNRFYRVNKDSGLFTELPVSDYFNGSGSNSYKSIDTFVVLPNDEIVVRYYDQSTSGNTLGRFALGSSSILGETTLYLGSNHYGLFSTGTSTIYMVQGTSPYLVIGYNPTNWTSSVTGLSMSNSPIWTSTYALSSDLTTLYSTGQQGDYAGIVTRTTGSTSALWAGVADPTIYAGNPGDWLAPLALAKQNSEIYVVSGTNLNGGYSSGSNLSKVIKITSTSGSRELLTINNPANGTNSITMVNGDPVLATNQGAWTLNTGANTFNSVFSGITTAYVKDLTSRGDLLVNNSTSWSTLFEVKTYNSFTLGPDITSDSGTGYSDYQEVDGTDYSNALYAEPRAVYWDEANQRILVAEFRSHRLLGVNPDTSKVTRIAGGIKGSGEDQWNQYDTNIYDTAEFKPAKEQALAYPFALAMDGQGRIYVASNNAYPSSLYRITEGNMEFLFFAMDGIRYNVQPNGKFIVEPDGTMYLPVGNHIYKATPRVQ